MTSSSIAVLALQKFGYTERQATFLHTVALHSGYFLRRQYLAFAGCDLGGTAQRLIDRLTENGHVRTLTVSDRTTVYQLYARPFYAAIGAEDNRNRRSHPPFAVRARLMTLDFVLAHQEAEFFATEQDRIALFTERMGLQITDLPTKVYRSKRRGSRTVRYFVDKNPVFLSAVPEGSTRTVGFAYIQGASDTTAGLRTYLAQYRRLLKAVPAFRLIFVTTDSKLIPAAKSAFNKMVGREESSEGMDPETQRLLEHFDARIRHEARDYSGFDTASLQRLSRELKEFSGARFDRLLTVYKTGGRARVLAEIAPGSSVDECPRGSFEACILEHSYRFVGDGWAA